MSSHSNSPASTPMMRALAAAIRSNTPALIWGMPGVGKTASIEAAAKSWGYHPETIVGSVREAPDFMGFPREDGSYTPLMWAQRLADADKAVLFLDELTTAPPSVQRVMLRIIEERFVGDFHLPDTVAIIAAANPPEVAVDGWELAAPVANRLFHIDWHFDLQNWLDGVVTDFVDSEPPSLDSMLGAGSNSDKARVRGAVTAFLRQRPDLVEVFPTNPAEAGKAWPSPRTWTKAMAILAELRPNDGEAALLVLKGCVGEGAAIEYLAWEATTDLADPAEVMENPSMIDWKNERPDRLFALVGAVSALVRMDLAGDRNNVRSWEKGMAVMVACAAGDRPDAATPYVRGLINQRPKEAKLTKDMRTAFAPILQRMGRLTAAAA